MSTECTQLPQHFLNFLQIGFKQQKFYKIFFFQELNYQYFLKLNNFAFGSDIQARQIFFFNQLQKEAKKCWSWGPRSNQH